MKQLNVLNNRNVFARRAALFMPFVFCSLFLFVSSSAFSQEVMSKKTWIITDLLKEREDVTVLGDPKIIDSPYGNAVQFDGMDDGFLLEEMPLKDHSEFTIEMLIRFDRGGTEEQRYFHTGTVKQDRVLMEMRSDDTTWYLDGMFDSNEKWVVLMDSVLTHPLDKWYHIAFTVKDGEQATFVNRKKELEGSVDFSPIEEGNTSIGVRQNKISWFKGAIYCVRITNKVLMPCEFLNFD
ncbi:LamG-like jellyroll fold domain-containing protein [Mangrovibacterium diazotrophicum]|uniref:Concanavalin A-like lectin/glucanase superfamily protein n=1 Tax=Mangrovibacterium diazotrophicum TaxID=1261403 RepID=A0A419W5Y9_9BACT|nr:LamG-like jellyroll fold domain-containing protein [Mangrovibacterium diazotrophicum]RKD90881.1 concanavalin A-like lectin/glucanase superfamily protein [Mangrovibacterium diazotrophicum]